MCAAATDVKPNVIFFMLDQLSAKWLDAACDGICPMPNVKRLREMGVNFRRAYTSNPVCCPARSTIVTGLTSRSHGVTENGYTLDPALPTFMQSLQKEGWRTGAFGKVHLHPHFAGVYPDYHPYGYDVTYNTEDPRAGEWLDWVRETHPQYFDAALATVWAIHLEEFKHYGKDKEDLTERIKEIRNSLDWTIQGRFPKASMWSYPLPFPQEVSQTDWITEHALAFLRDTPADTPVHAHISYVQPHGPHCAPVEYFDLVDTARLPEACPIEWQSEDDPAPYFKKERQQKVTSAEEAKWLRHCYFADLAHLDVQLGRVLDTLEETGRLASSYIVLLADHGEMLGDHGFRGKEERHYDACIHIPLIVAGPGCKSGAVCEELVQLEDICPTVLEMTGTSLPVMPKDGMYLNKKAEEIPSVFGHSLLPLCKGQGADGWRKSVHVESYCGIWSDDPTDWARSVVTDDWRYTWYPDGGEQLFHLKDDPDEQQNRAKDDDCRDMREQLREALMRHIVLQDYPRTRRALFALGIH